MGRGRKKQDKMGLKKKEGKETDRQTDRGDGIYKC